MLASDQLDRMVEIPALGFMMLQVAVDNDEPLAGRHPDQRIRMAAPPFLDLGRIDACVFETVFRERPFVGTTWEDGNIPRGELECFGSGAHCRAPMAISRIASRGAIAKRSASLSCER